MNVELNAELTLASGDRIRWDAAAPDAGKRPLSPSFDTETGKGFSTGSVTLQRPTDRDYPELRLLNELTLRSASGQIVYQGRAQGIPAGEAFSFDCDGWWTHGEQRQITDLIIDREASAWGATPNAEKVRLQTYNLTPSYDASTQGSFIRLEIPRMANVSGKRAYSVTTYRSPGQIGRAQIKHDGGSGSPWIIQLETSLGPAATNATAYVSTTNASAGTLTAIPQGPTRYAHVAYRYNTDFTGDGPWIEDVIPTVYGETGIATADRADGLDGFIASDGIRYLANRYCPKWDTSDVQPSSYLIPHAVWREPTTPADAIRQLNSYHLWRLGVWEDRRLTFAPYDLSVADWQVASGVDGVRVDYQGDTTENVYNGVTVSFTGFDGEQYRLTPEDSEDLRDRSEWISANEWGDEVWLNIDVSWPASQADAVEIGRLALANANEARRPSTITVPATIRDIHGSEWPSSYVRADQTIVVTNQTPAIPRLITRTSWSDHTLQITTDNAVDTFAAFTTRLSGALSASGVI
jgi:hypothetical protein